MGYEATLEGKFFTGSSYGLAADKIIAVIRDALIVKDGPF
jgi:hypothetical protein